MEQKELIPHLFRTEAGKITAVLCKVFSIQHIEVAEDITSETFLLALETWTYKGIPDNPVAWLHTVARNKAKNQLHRARIGEKISKAIQSQQEIGSGPDIDLSPQNISDSQLQMLFALCHPSIPVEAQIGLSLRILCGFGIDEIASAFLTGKETINKRLFRAKEKLRADNVAIEFPTADEIGKRLEAVLTTLYLLFSEGYYSECQDRVLREDLCQEAMRLTHLLVENKETNCPEANALLSLMYFHTSRFPARKDASGAIILYDDQDEALWDQTCIARGAYYLHQSAQGNRISTYHLEASIAYWHTIKHDTPGKWENILQLYNTLLQIQYSPIAALNRTYALSKANGKREAIQEARKLNLTGNPYYYSLLGELFSGIDDEQAKQHFTEALKLSQTQADRNIISKKIDALTQ